MRIFVEPSARVVDDDVLADVRHPISALELDAERVAAVLDRHVAGLADVERLDVQRARTHVGQLPHGRFDGWPALGRRHVRRQEPSRRRGGAGGLTGVA